jgi:hypothetical protein
MFPYLSFCLLFVFTLCGPKGNDSGMMFPLCEQRLYLKYMEFLCKGNLTHLTFILSLNHLLTLLWKHGYLSYILGYISIILYFVLQIVWILAIGSTFSGPFRHSSINQSYSFCIFRDDLYVLALKVIVNWKML